MATASTWWSRSSESCSTNCGFGIWSAYCYVRRRNILVACRSTRIIPRIRNHSGMTSSMVSSNVPHNLTFFCAAANALLGYKVTRVNMTSVQRLWKKGFSSCSWASILLAYCTNIQKSNFLFLVNLLQAGNSRLKTEVVVAQPCYAQSNVASHSALFSLTK